MPKTSTDKTTKSLVTCPKSPGQETIIPVTMEATTSPHSVMADKTMISQTAQYENLAKETESSEEGQAHKATVTTSKATKATVKVAIKTS